MQNSHLAINNLQSFSEIKAKKVLLILFNPIDLGTNKNKEELEDKFINTLYENFQKVGVQPYFISFFSPKNSKHEQQDQLLQAGYKEYTKTKPRIINLSINSQFLDFYNKGFSYNGQYKILAKDRNIKDELERDDPKYNYNISDKQSLAFYKEWLERIIIKNPNAQIIMIDRSPFLSPFLGKIAINNPNIVSHLQSELQS